MTYAEVQYRDERTNEIVRGFENVEFGDIWLIFDWANNNRFAVPVECIAGVDIGETEE